MLLEALEACTIKKKKSSDAGFSPFSLESPWKMYMQVQEHLEMW